MEGKDKNTDRPSQLPAVLPGVGSVEAYIQMAYRAPMLTEQEEQDLAHRWQDQKDLDAARQLVLSHVRYVIHIARQYRRFGVPFSDLIQEGTVGLMKAVKRFDPSKGARLATFSLHWIKSEIHEFILRNWRMVKIATTKAQRKLFFNLHKHLSGASSLTQDQVQHIADTLDVRPQDVRTMETRLHGQDDAFDAAPDERPDALPAPADRLSTNALDPARLLEHADWEHQRLERLHEALETLDDRDRHIIEARWLHHPKQTLHALAERFNVSPERIRQLEKKALKKLNDACSPNEKT